LKSEVKRFGERYRSAAEQTTSLKKLNRLVVSVVFLVFAFLGGYVISSYYRTEQILYVNQRDSHMASEFIPVERTQRFSASHLHWGVPYEWRVLARFDRRDIEEEIRVVRKGIDKEFENVSEPISIVVFQQIFFADVGELLKRRLSIESRSEAFESFCKDGGYNIHPIFPTPFEWHVLTGLADLQVDLKLLRNRLDRLGRALKQRDALNVWISVCDIYILLKRQ